MIEVEKNLSIDSFYEFCKETAAHVKRACWDLLSPPLKADPQLKEAVSLALTRRKSSIYPLLFRVAYSSSDSRFGKIRKMAAAIHLLQVSTFVIDDVLDKSDIRNQQPTVASQYGPDVAIVVGEILQGVASHHINQSILGGRFRNSREAAKLLNTIMSDVYLGQFLDLRSSGDLSWTPRDYLRTISLTTGGFLSKITRSAALLAGRSRDQCAALAKFGHCYGMAVQIIDDILDLADPEVTGKTFASDLANRRMRLPYILALRSSWNGLAESMRRFFSEAGGTDIQDLAVQLSRSGILEDCKQVASQYVRAARKPIAVVEERFARSVLSFLCEELLRSADQKSP